MAEYVEREAALKALCGDCGCFECKSKEPSIDLCQDYHNLATLPAADVRPVVRGKWENIGSDVWRCSQCGYGIMPWNAGQNFCPNCGADMRPTSMSGANGEES